MGGALIHARTFHINRWPGLNGRSHHELVPDDGDYDFLSYGHWKEIKDRCETFGMPRDVWPDFQGYRNTIDLPLERVEAKQGPFREAILRLPPEALSFDPWMPKIVEWLRDGQMVFFC